MTIPRTLLHASRDPEIGSAVALKVLIRLHETLNDTDFKQVQTWYVANQLQTDESTVRRGFMLLESLGYIERGERNGSCFTFRLRDPSVKMGPNSPQPPAHAA